MRFYDRFDAGQRLTERLRQYQKESPLIFATPRGGVPVGYEVAHELEAPLEIIVSRKIGAPSHPEFGIGAVAEGGVVYLDPRALSILDLTESELEARVAEETREMERQVRHYREGRPLPEVRGRTVILVDDGIATGTTVRAALRALRQRGPRKLILALPVAAEEPLAQLAEEADEIICLNTPNPFIAVGLWYRHFQPVSEAEVFSLLDRARRERRQATRRSP